MLKIKSKQNRLGPEKYHIVFLFGTYVGNMKPNEPRYIESPRDVCWGSGIVALDDL